MKIRIGLLAAVCCFLLWYQLFYRYEYFLIPESGDSAVGVMRVDRLTDSWSIVPHK